MLFIFAINFQLDLQYVVVIPGGRINVQLLLEKTVFQTNHKSPQTEFELILLTYRK